jgi:processive 1,2-diacylglycerol beta-glucosyltransferase
MPSKRILLMYISNVSGHRSASLAIEKALKLISPQTRTLALNAFKYTHPRGEKIVNSVYMFMIQRLPFLWGHLYDNPAWFKKIRRLKDMLHYCNLSKLEALFNDFRPDLVVSTQAFPCGMVADFKRAKGIKLPLVAVLTDFIPHSYWIYNTVNYYIVPSAGIMHRLIEKGVGAERIRPLGIPFDLKFNQEFDKPAIRKRLNLEAGLFTVLVMGGGQGLGPLKKIVEVLENSGHNLQEIVVCGTNKRAYQRLKNRLGRYKRKISLFGYAENIEELMSAADIIITKPGGITCAEALSKGLPMLIISPIPGQEASNTAYLTAQGAAIKISQPKDLLAVIDDLYNHPEKLKELSAAALRMSKPNAAQDIAQLLLGV